MTRSPYTLKVVDPVSSHARVVDILGRALADRPAPRILDVGCAGGLIKRTAELLEHPLAREAAWVGIDCDPGELADAARAGMEVHQVDLATDALPPLPGTFDAVVLADVLEHFPRPAEVLARLLPAVCTRQTVIVVSLPNVANLYVRIMIACGRWEYQDRGLLDRGHLRFFTRRTARRLLEEAGLHIRGTWVTPVPLYRVTTSLLAVPERTAAVQRALLSLTRLAPTLLGYQFVFEAQRAGA